MPVNLPYPLQFDPSQLKDPYSLYADEAFPWYGSAIGSSGTYGNQVPTDAMGQPIQSYTDTASAQAQQYQQQMADYQKALAAYNAGGGGSTQGTTINNTGGSAAASGLPQAQQAALGQWGPAINELMQNSQAAQAAKSPQQLAIDAQNNAMRDQMLQQQATVSAVQAGNGGFGNMAGGAFNPGSYAPTQLMQAPGATAPARPAAPTAPSQPNMTQAYIAALQSPGHVTTPGATVPQSAAPSTQSNVLQQFVANWQPGANPAGNYNNKSIIDAMRGNV